MKQVRRYLLIITMIFIILMLIRLPVFASELEKIEYTQEYLKWIEDTEKGKENSIRPLPFAISKKSDNITEIETPESFFNKKKNFILNNLKGTVNSKYNLNIEDGGDIAISVGNQGKTNTCWAFSTNSIIETHVSLKSNTTSNPIKYSARFLEYDTAKTFLDGINPLAYDREVGDGGNPYMALSRYISGRGPVLESEMPFENNQNKINLSEIEGKTANEKIDSYIVFPTIFKTKTSGILKYKKSSNATTTYSNTEINEIRNQIKEHIVKNGAVTAFTYSNGAEYYTTPTGTIPTNIQEIYLCKSYFCDGYTTETADHQITIVGWDDNYEITNFNVDHRPTSPGAYIALNSWGTQFGENGYYYISYEDAFVENAMFGIEEVSTPTNQNIYQHDFYGLSEGVGYNGSKIIYGANVFSKNENSKEKLTEVGISSLQDLKCEIYINPTGNDLSSANLIKVTNTQRELHPGYQVIKLDKVLKLTGEKFAIVVKYISENEDAMITIENRTQEKYLSAVTSNLGESFASKNGIEWSDFKSINTYSNANICIKGFTETYKEIQSIIYLTDTQNSYIYKIPQNTQVIEFKSNFTNVETMVIKDSEGNNLTDTQKIGTGMKVIANEEEYILVVSGDINGDSRISITDLLALKFHIIRKTGRILKNERLKAADLNYNGNANITDLARMAKTIIGVY